MNLWTHLFRHAARLFSTIIGCAIFCAASGCDGGNVPAPTSAPSPTVASLSPAATDLLLGMGEGNHLVAVSDYDTDERIADLPRVGAYQTFDFERLALVRPDVMVVQKDPASLPTGARENAEQLGITFYNATIVRLPDIEATLRDLAEIVGADADAKAAAFTAALDEACGPPIEGDRPAVLVLLNDELTFAVGRENYLSDLIEACGGENAVPASMTAWPTLGREALLSLTPEAVVLILPDATPEQLAAAESRWKEVAETFDLPWEEVTVVTDEYAMIPGWRVIDLARRLRVAIESAS